MTSSSIGPESASVQVHSAVTGLLRQPFGLAAGSARWNSMSGGVESILKVWSAGGEVLPARSVQVPESVAAVVSGPV